MAQYYSEVDYCAEEMNRPYAGGEHYAVRKQESYEEVDEVVARAGRGHHHGGHGGGGHLGRSGSRHHQYGGHLGHEAGHHGPHLVHGERRHDHGHGGRHCDAYACESKYVVDSCTAGQYD